MPQPDDLPMDGEPTRIDPILARLSGAHQPLPPGTGTGGDTTTASQSIDWFEKLLAEQQRQWSSGQAGRLESFFEQEPLLRLDKAAQIQLIEREIHYRASLGQSPHFEEYLARFPKLDRELRELFRQSITHPTMALASDLNDLTLPRQEDTSPDSKLGPVKVGKRSGSQISIRFLEAASAAGYDVIEEIGRGGMGVVYKAKHRNLKRLVALKTLHGRMNEDEEMMARFRKEAMAIAKLQHPNIVAVYDVGEFEDNPYLTLEFVDGGSLADLILKSRQAPLQAAMLAEPLARGAHAAHQQGIIHRDLKPANVLLMKDGTPKISDFGLAKHMDDSTGWTRTGDVMGTPCYMAPEQAEGKIKSLGPATDVYALGTILYETITGAPPFRGATSLETLEMVRTHEPPPLRKFSASVPKDLETIILKCLEKDPAQRYPSAQELAEDLCRFIQDEPIAARRGGSLTRLSRWWRKNQVVATMVIMMLVLAAVLAQQFMAFLNRDKVAENVPTGPAPSKEAPLVPTAAGTNVPGSSPVITPTPTPGADAPRSETKPAMPSVAKTMPTKASPPPVIKPPTFEETLELARTAGSPDEALKHYEAAWLMNRNTASPRKKVELYKQVLSPALRLAGDLPTGGDAETMRRIARLFAEEGRLLRDLPYEEWGFTGDVHKVAAQSFDQALRYHPKGEKPDRLLAEYHTGHGIALTRMEGQKPADIEKELLADAEAAIAAAPDYAGGWNLKGFILYHKAFQEFADLSFEASLMELPNRQMPLGPIEEAITAYNQAVTKAQESSPPDDNAAIYLTNRSAANLLLGYMQEDAAQRKQSLTAARADGLAATKLAADYDLGWQALGLACEALAWKTLKVNQKERYGEAQAAYEQQIKLRGGQADAHLNLGRCLAKWTLDDEGAAELKARATAALGEAVNYDKDKGEAWFWKGRLAFAAKDKAAAEDWQKGVATPNAQSVLQQLRPLVGKDLKEYHALLDTAIKANEKEPALLRTPLYLMRALWLAQNEPKGLAEAEPAALKDIQEAGKLAVTPLQKALVPWATAVVCLRIVSTSIPVDKKIARLEEFIKEAEEFLKQRPNSQGALPVLKEICNVAELFGKATTRSKEQRKMYLKKAIDAAEQATELATGADRNTWLRRRQDLQKELRELGE